MPRKRRVCFVTGTRAEFGLMQSVLQAIRSNPQLELQVVATGMHLDRPRGYSLREISTAGFNVNAKVAWESRRAQPRDVAQQTGQAVAQFAAVFERLQSDVVLVVGDRVEAFAAATAAHIGGRVVAHVHGGDRALGQVDDSLRHAITKLAHVHFPATRQSAQRIRRLGENNWRIRLAGSPGIDGILKDAASRAQLKEAGLELPPRRYALLVLHPVDADNSVEHRRAVQLLRAVKASGVEQLVIIYPNNDPGSAGIIAAWTSAAREDQHIVICPNLSRPLFLGLLRDAAILVGNSSSGIIEAASFGTPVVNVGPRQKGRERSENVTDVPYRELPIRRAVERVWNDGVPRRLRRRNLYGRGNAGQRISQVLSRLVIDHSLRRKLISY